MNNAMSKDLVRLVSYPGIMVGVFVLFVLLQRAGVPLTLSSYVGAAVAAGLITLHEIMLPHRNDWKPDRGEIANDAMFLIAVQMLLPYMLSLAAALWLAGSVQSNSWAIATLWPGDLPVPRSGSVDAARR